FLSVIYYPTKLVYYFYFSKTEDVIDSIYTFEKIYYKVIRSDKKLRELKAALEKGNKIFQIDAIRSLRDEEPFEGAIGALVSFYDTNNDKSILRIIEDFFNDIKYQSASNEVIAEIRKPWKNDTISMLVASCWQSGLDYSEYMADMTDIFLTRDYATAIECMTVIEESVTRSSREEKDRIIKIVENSPLAYSVEKSPLTHELITILHR
ncbi:MAG: hypothetical protein JXN62_03245, partial [Bacteroidales bacterium]|nr:hypothetical protein [Bacteroidales bacterium]